MIVFKESWVGDECQHVMEFHRVLPLNIFCSLPVTWMENGTSQGRNDWMCGVIKSVPKSILIGMVGQILQDDYAIHTHMLYENKKTNK